MIKDFIHGFEVFADVLLPLVISLCACLTRQAQYGWHGTRQFLREYVVCAFMGVLIFWGLDYVDLPPTVDAAIIGGCSFASMSLLDAITKKLTRVVRDFNVPGSNSGSRRDDHNLPRG